MGNALDDKQTPVQTVSHIVALVGLRGAAGAQTWGAAPAGVGPGDVASRTARAGLAGGAARHATRTRRQGTGSVLLASSQEEEQVYFSSDKCTYYK